MQKVYTPYFDPDFDSLQQRIYGPTCKVCFDNETLDDSTLVKVDGVNKQEILLEVVQILTDMNLTISKSYISSDAGWIMDVFHVKDEHGNKLSDPVIDYIQQAIDSTRETPRSVISTQNNTHRFFESSDNTSDRTSIEMTGADRPGLFSEISAALAELHCNIVEAHAWSHNARLACVAYISDQSTDTPIYDPNRLADIEDHLTTVLRATSNPDCNTLNPDQREVKTSDIHGCELGTMGTMGNFERRLHQLMLSVLDFEEPVVPSSSGDRYHRDIGGMKTNVSIESCDERGYSIVNVDAKDRPRLMFDTICTLTDLQYVVFHASTASHGDYAFQEYFIRHVDGHARMIKSEKDRVIKCLEAAIERRVCEGVKLELCANNRVGLLSDISRVLRENGLLVVRADIETQGEKAMNAFYLKDVSGNEIDMHFVESVEKEMEPIYLNVKNETPVFNRRRESTPERSRFGFPIADVFKSQIERLSRSFTQI